MTYHFRKILIFLLLLINTTLSLRDIECHDPDLKHTQNKNRKFILFGSEGSQGAGIGNVLIFFPAIYYYAAFSGRDIIIGDGSIVGEWLLIGELVFIIIVVPAVAVVIIAATSAVVLVVPKSLFVVLDVVDVVVAVKIIIMLYYFIFFLLSLFIFFSPFLVFSYALLFSFSHFSFSPFPLPHISPFLISSFPLFLFSRR